MTMSVNSYMQNYDRSASTGTSSIDAVGFNIATAVASDPSNIVGSSSQNGMDISVTLDALTISNTPATAAYWEADVTDVDMADVLRFVMKAGTLAPPSADIWIGYALTVADGSRGYAVRIASASGDWVVEHTSAVSLGSWSAWTSSTASASAQGFVGQVLQGNAATQARLGAYAVDSAGACILGASATAPSQNNIGNDFTKVRICVGWVTGSGGTNPTTITFRAAHLHSKLSAFTSISQLFL